MNYLAERQVIHMDMTGRWRNAVLFGPMIKWESEKKVKQLEGQRPSINRSQFRTAQQWLQQGGNL
jgi:hypothetical protein